MSSAAAVHARRLRKTKAELVSEIESLEVRLARAGPANDARTGDKRPLVPDHVAEPANLPGECPYPVFRVTPDRRVLYANEATHAVPGLLIGRRRNRLTAKLADELTAANRARKSRITEFHAGDRVFSLIFTPVADQPYVNV